MSEPMFERFTEPRACAQVAGIVGSGEHGGSGQIPFTPRAKQVLELALREALSLGHQHIDTERRGGRRASAAASRVILVDVNLLVDATMTSARDHDAARAWLQDRLAGTARVGLPWASITGFVRVVGQPRAWERPLPVAGAVSVVRSWLSRPCAWIPEPGPRHLDVLHTLLEPQPSVRLVTDAHLAAIAIEHGLELSSRDRDFARWSDLGLRSRDPLA